MIAPGSSHSSFRSALQVPLRHKRRFLTVFLAVVGTTILVTLLMPRTYRSEGELLLRLGRENMALDPTATLGSTPILSIQQSRENEINSVIEIVRSRVLIEKVVDALSPARILGKNEGQSADREDAIRHADQIAERRCGAQIQRIADYLRRCQPNSGANGGRHADCLFPGRAYSAESHARRRAILERANRQHSRAARGAGRRIAKAER